MPNSVHKSVLLQESIDGLDLQPGEIFLDGTLGGGGHSREVLRRFPDVRIIGLDKDRAAIERTKDLAIEVKIESFRNLDKVLEELSISSVDAILFDLGLSSNQFEESGRGFSFQKDEPLLMTMTENPGADDLTAAKILNTFSEEALELILRGFGEEKFSRKIAREIVTRREVKPFKTTFDLVEAVESQIPHFASTTPRLRWASKASRGKHPATRTFQALRIAVNEELTALEEGLEKGFKALSPSGRFAVISFHSLEDRIVKQFFRKKADQKEALLINKKPVIPTDEETKENPRSRSAKLRIIEKLCEKK